MSLRIIFVLLLICYSTTVWSEEEISGNHNAFHTCVTDHDCIAFGHLSYCASTHNHICQYRKCKTDTDCSGLLQYCDNTYKCENKAASLASLIIGILVILSVCGCFSVRYCIRRNRVRNLSVHISNYSSI